MRGVVQILWGPMGSLNLLTKRLRALFLNSREAMSNSDDDGKPVMDSPIIAASQCLDRAAALLREDISCDDVIAELNAAKEFLSDVADEYRSKQDFALEILNEVYESIETNRKRVEILSAEPSSPACSQEPSRNVSDASHSSDGRTPATDNRNSAASIAGLRRHVSQDMGLSSVAGMVQAKQMLTEAVVLPIRYRHLFTGARKPWQSVLLYGPPGTGKTRLALAVAAEVQAELYAISPADLLSSWFGATEQNIRELFGQLRLRARSQRVIVFLDEVDGLCRRRTKEEAESTRRMKTELLTQLQENTSQENQRPEGSQDPNDKQVVQGGQLFFVCATNCPWEIDSAFLRRFQRRIFIGLPDRKCRLEMIRSMAAGSGDSFLPTMTTDLSLMTTEWQRLLDQTEGFSGSDLADLVKNAMYQPIRELTSATHWVPASATMWVPCSRNTIGAVRQELHRVPPNMVSARNVSIQDFFEVIASCRPTVRPEDLARYEQFTNQFGQMG